MWCAATVPATQEAEVRALECRSSEPTKLEQHRRKRREKERGEGGKVRKI